MNASTPANSGAKTGAWRRFWGSVRLRLTLWFVAILALVLAVFSAFVYTRQAQVLRSETASRLAARSSQLSEYYLQQIRESAEHEDEGEAFRPPAGSLPLLQGDDLFALVNREGSLVQQSGELSPSQISAVLSAWQQEGRPANAFSVPLGASGEHQFLAAPIEGEHGWSGVLLLGSPNDSSGQLPRLALALAAGSLLTLMLASAGGYWLAHRAISPVQAITRTARLISEKDLSQRLNLQQPDELGELADTFDQMLERLQAAFERQRQFTADASHELRTPLSILSLESSRVLERPRTPDEYRKALQIVQAESEWMARLVDEMLVLARLDQSSAAHTNEVNDLSEIAVEALERLQPLATQRQVLLQPGRLEEAPVNASRDPLSRIAANLVENAIKYSSPNGMTPAGRVWVECGTGERQGRRRSWLRVSDNGPGIPAEHLPHVFERFYRQDASRTRKDGGAAQPPSGSGLGLAIVQSIAQSYGGEVQVESQPGKGSSFTVWLPAPHGM